MLHIMHIFIHLVYSLLSKDLTIQNLIRPQKRLTSSSCIFSGQRNQSMWPDRVASPRPLNLESDALPTALRGPVPFSFEDAI